MLVTCPECRREISEHADACPACGFPMRGWAAAPRGVRTVEQTGKKWKLIQLVSILGVLISTVWAVIVSQVASTESSAIAWPALAGGLSLALYVYGRVGAWWNHG